jgi:type I restriction enzyme S subunit
VKDLAVERGLIGGPFGSDLVANDYVENGVPVIRGQNLPNSKRFVGGDFVYVSKSKADELRRNQALPGDIIATQRGTLGQVAIVPQQAFDRYVISQSQMRLRVDLDVALPDFVYLWLDWSDTRAAIDSRRSATANPHINLRIFGELAGVLPPVTKQREIIDLIAPIDEFESHLDQSTELSRNFRSALLSDLLSGSHEVPASYDELMGAA